MTQLADRTAIKQGATRARAVLFDIDGVLMVSGEAIPGAREAILKVERAGVPFAFITNMTRPRSAVLARMETLGIETDPARLFSAPAATLRYLQENFPDAPCLLYADTRTREDFDGINLTMDPMEAAVVVIGGPHDDSDNRHLSYECMNDAYRAVANGAALVAMQRGLSWQTARGLELDAGAFVTALEVATGTKATVCGKPSPLFFTQAVAQLGVPPSEVLMVGDDVENDIRGAAGSGLIPVLVRTGKFHHSHVGAIRGIPFHLIDSVADVPALLGVA